MGVRLIGWLINICLLGLIPCIARLFVWAISHSGVDPVAISDLVAFGLVVHSANINEISRSGSSGTWKTLFGGVSIVFIVIYGLLLFTTIASSNELDPMAMMHATELLSLASFVVGGTVVMTSISRHDRKWA